MLRGEAEENPVFSAFNTVTVTLYAKDKAGHKSAEKVFTLNLGEQLLEEEASKIQVYEREFDIALGPINMSIPLKREMSRVTRGRGGGGSELDHGKSP